MYNQKIEDYKDIIGIQERGIKAIIERLNAQTDAYEIYHLESELLKTKISQREQMARQKSLEDVIEDEDKLIDQKYELIKDSMREMIQKIKPLEVKMEKGLKQRVQNIRHMYNSRRLTDKNQFVKAFELLANILNQYYASQENSKKEGGEENTVKEPGNGKEVTLKKV